MKPTVSSLVRLLRAFRNQVDVSTINNSKRTTAQWAALVEQADAMLPEAAKIEPTALKDLLLTHGKTIDAAHDALSKEIEDDTSNDDIRDKAIYLCEVLNAFHEARRAALGDDGVLALHPASQDGPFTT